MRVGRNALEDIVQSAEALQCVAGAASESETFGESVIEAVQLASEGGYPGTDAVTNPTAYTHARVCNHLIAPMPGR